jgi:hypothetical protein
MKALELALKKQPIVYITLDLERALGLPVTTKNYFIITNSDTFSNSFKNYSNILRIKEKKLLSTRELLEHPKTNKFLSKIDNPHIVVFKNTLPIEEICEKNNWTLLNPSAALANNIEEKISQITWLGPLSKLLPPYNVLLCKKVVWRGEKFILQFNSAHTGNGTFLITSREELAKLQKQFPDRPVRVLKYIEGLTITNNNIVWGKQVLCGNINYQITGLPPFTDRPFATIGNDWALPQRVLSKKQLKDYYTIAQKVGKKLASSGWKGLFGIDVLFDPKTGRLYLIEVNARQPASTTCESQLQKTTNRTITTFEAHLASLLTLPYNQATLAVLNTGAQVIKRIFENQADLPLTQKKQLQKKLIKQGFSSIAYENKNPGSESLRIQSTQSIMADHNTFNTIGNKLRTLFM